MNHLDPHDPIGERLAPHKGEIVPPEVEASAHAALASLRNRMDRRESRRRERPIMSTLKRGFGSKLAWAGSLAAATVVIILAFGLLPGGGGGTSAWAQAVEKLRNARSVTYSIIVSMEHLPEPMNKMPPMRMDYMWKEPGLLRMEAPGTWGVMDIVRRKGISVMDAQRTYIEMDLSEIPEEQFIQQTGGIEYMRRMPERAERELGEREFDGRRLLGFLCREQGMEYEVWIDPLTHDPVRVEMSIPQADMRATIVDFRFDVELDDAIFDMTPPADYKRMDLKLEQPAEKHLIGFFRFWTARSANETFPPGMDMGTIMTELRKIEMKDIEALDMQQQMDQMMPMQLSMQFVTTMTPDNDWYYRGEGLRLGTEEPICWWRPTGSEFYRVVFGNLEVLDYTPEALEQLKSIISEK